jgi:hypothetical protein
VQDAFSSNPFKGWIDELDAALPVKDDHKSSGPPNIMKLIDQASDRILIDRMLGHDK